MSENIDDCFKKNVPNYTYRKGYKSDIKYCIDWHDFILLANFEYNSGYGGAEIPSDLIVVGKDFYMTRGEYDGSEWWDYHTQPVKPENSIKCTKLKGDGLWGDLERFQ